LAYLSGQLELARGTGATFIAALISRLGDDDPFVPRFVLGAVASCSNPLMWSSTPPERREYLLRLKGAIEEELAG